jgi:outer membrane protein
LSITLRPTGRSRHAPTIVGAVLVLCMFGCTHSRSSTYEDFSQRILPPATVDPLKTEVSGGGQAQLGRPESIDHSDIREVGSSLPTEASCAPDQILTLEQAIGLAFRQQPRLRVFLEGVEQAARGEDIAFAPFLPTVVAETSSGGFDLNAGGNITLPGSAPNFAFLPPLGAIPLGLDIKTGFELSDLKLQWLICDFGRRMGRYRQAGLGVEIAQLQTERAFQTVANEVSVGYYQVLRARALRKTAVDAVRRGQEDVDTARKLEKGGVIEKEKRLRVEVQLAESQRMLDVAEGAEIVAVAALNLAIGLNVNAATGVVEVQDMPVFPQTLAECLQTAVGVRREFRIARTSIEVADEGRRVAKADFAPRIVAEGSLLDFEQSAPRAHADLAVGMIKLEWGLFEGGKRVAEVRVADSKIRAAVAQAESIADTIAFQVTEAYRHLITARRGIDRARPAVSQAEESYRYVRARAKVGDATSAEIIDAESALTRAEQDYRNSIHDYLIALVRIEYAMGTTPTTETSRGHR